MSHTPGRVRLVDIAKACGVSKTAVSLALNGSSQIGAATRERIEATAAELGYRREPALRRLADYRWQNAAALQSINLGFIQPRPNPFRRRDCEQEQVAASIARSLGYALELFTATDYPDAASLARVLRARGIEGLALAPWIENDFLDDFPWDDFAAINIDAGEKSPPLHTVTYDAFNDTLRALRALTAAGARRIAVVNVVNQRPTLTDKLTHAAGAYAEVEERAQRRITVLPYVLTVQAPIQPLVDWIANLSIDGVFAPNAAIAQCLVERGVAIPHGVKLAVASLQGETQLEWPGWIRRRHQVCLRAFHWLDRMVRRSERGLAEEPETLYVPSQWNAGKNCPIDPQSPFPQEAALSP